MNKISFKRLSGFETKILIDWFNELSNEYGIGIGYHNYIIDDMVCDFTFQWEKELDIILYKDYIEIKCPLASDRVTIDSDEFYEISFS